MRSTRAIANIADWPICINSEASAIEVRSVCPIFRRAFCNASMKSSAARLSLLGTRDKLAQMSVDALADLETAKTEIIAAKAQMSAEIV